MPAPAYNATGAFASGSGVDVSPGLPAGWAAGHIHILLIETDATDPALLPAGWSIIGAGGITSAGSEFVYGYRRAVGGDTAPTVSAVAGHMTACVLGFSGCITSGSPIDVYAETSLAAGTAQTWSAVTTTGADRMVVCVGTRDDDLAGASQSAFANASLTGVAENCDGGTALGTGGGIFGGHGVKAAAGSSGASTSTTASCNSALLTFALLPVPGGGMIFPSPLRAALPLLIR